MAAPNPATAPEAEASLPVRDVFESLADELEQARALGLRVEGAICAIAVRSAVDGSIVSELQHLDAILQHIAALRDFSAELARRCDPAPLVPVQSALDRVTLGEVRARLGGGRLTDNPDEIWEML